MQINLRQADALKRGIIQYINEHALKNTVSISLYEGAGIAIGNANIAFQTNFVNYVRLEQLLADIKYAVAGVNDKSGIDQLLNEQSRLERLTKTLKSLADVQKPAPTIQAVEAQVASQLKRNETSDYRTTESIEVMYLNQDSLKNISEQIQSYKRRNQEIKDALLVANLGKTIVVSDEDYKFLQDLGIV